MIRRAIFVVNDFTSATAFRQICDDLRASSSHSVIYSPDELIRYAVSHPMGGIWVQATDRIVDNACWNSKFYPDPSWCSYVPDGIENVYTQENFRAGFAYLLGTHILDTRRLGRRNIQPLPIP